MMERLRVGASGAGAIGHLLQAPAGDGEVVAREQDLRDFEALPDAGAGVVGAVEEAGGFGDAELAEPLGAKPGVQRLTLGVGGGGRGEAVLKGGVGVAEGAGDEADDGVHEDEGGQLASREDVVADRDLEGGEFLDDAFVDALVVAAEEEEAGPGGEIAYEGLVEGDALGGQEDARCGAGVLGFGGDDGVPDGLAGHDHARAAAEGAAVGFVVLVVGVVADVGGVPGDEACGAGAGGDGEAERGGGAAIEHLGEGGEDVEAHRGRIEVG